VSGDPGAPPRKLRRAAVRVLRLLVVLVLIVLFFRLVQQVDWGQVVDALTRLTGPELIVVGGCVVARQCLDATPLALFVSGLGLRRAMANDLTGYVVGTLAPAPSDMVLRMAMFRGWGVDLAHGAAGLALNALVYYVGRFSAPVVGLVVFVSWYGWDATYAWAALGGAAVAGFLLGLLFAVSRGQRRAYGIGRRAGLVAARLTRRPIEADRWGTRLVEFQQVSSNRVAERFAMAALSVAALLAVDAAILVLSLRFAGLSASDLALPAIVAAFLCVYPLTALPLAGLGFLDASAIALFELDTNSADQKAVAAFVVWRVATLLTPLLLGTGTLLYWRHSHVVTRAGRPVDHAPD
jgi:putative heme transporter